MSLSPHVTLYWISQPTSVYLRQWLKREWRLKTPKKKFYTSFSPFKDRMYGTCRSRHPTGRPLGIKKHKPVYIEENNYKMLSQSWQISNCPGQTDRENGLRFGTCKLLWPKLDDWLQRFFYNFALKYQHYPIFFLLGYLSKIESG